MVLALTLWPAVNVSHVPVCWSFTSKCAVRSVLLAILVDRKWDFNLYFSLMSFSRPFPVFVNCDLLKDEFHFQTCTFFFQLCSSLISYSEWFLCQHQQRISWRCPPTSELCSDICVWCSWQGYLKAYHTMDKNQKLSVVRRTDVKVPAWTGIWWATFQSVQ